ncbi:hypothetical protein P3875_00740 [Myroides sp. JBRI-B21084]|uniref:hypothetical protein n=1 Tax=Myroides sp. JBRI-B21084 TaxID=3119977 RepID=UPI0026E2EF64|nr:hypothetical protein [Paenimyroides cloacae]WKW46639.1 hypothetical protein P3875_00740 [Paenimyroides cloacae]
MKNIYLFALICFVQLTTAQNFDNEITFIQNNKTQVVFKENETITLQKQPFKIRFTSKIFRKFNDENQGLKATIIQEKMPLYNIEEGMPISLIPFFENSNRIAVEEDGFYFSAVVDNYMHHLLFYENEMSRNTEMVTNKTDWGTFEWQINRIYLNGKDLPMQQLKTNRLTFIFLTDFNANKIIDANELRIVNVQFN